MLSDVGKGNILMLTRVSPVEKLVTTVVLHHKYMILFKPFTPHVIAWSVRKGFNQSIRRTKEQ